MTYILRDQEDGHIDAVITTVTSKKEDIKKAIAKMKRENEGCYSYYDLPKYLPEDATVAFDQKKIERMEIWW